MRNWQANCSCSSLPYSMSRDEEYETLRLRRAFAAASCGEDVTELLKGTVAEIIVERQTVKLRLKNRQTIERREPA